MFWRTEWRRPIDLWPLSDLENHWHNEYFLSSFIKIPVSAKETSHSQSSHRVPTTLTFDLWPYKPFQVFLLLWWIFLASFVKIPKLSKEEISRHKYVFNLLKAEVSTGYTLLSRSNLPF